MSKPVPPIIGDLKDAILSVPQFCQWANCSRRHFYILEAEGKIRAVRDGRRVKINGADALAYKESLFAHR